jgi:hypothetical protein
VADRIHYFQGHHFIGEQLQCPVSVTCWRLTQPHGDQLRFGFAIELARRGRLRAFLAVQSQFEAFNNQTFAEILDRLHAAESLRDLDVRPSRPIGIRLQQNLSTTKLLRGSFEILDNPLTDNALFIRQTDNELLVHGNLLVMRSFPTIPKISNPNS